MNFTITTDYEEGSFYRENVQLSTRDQTVEALRSSIRRTDRAWELWHKEYLTSLRDYHKLQQGQTTRRPPAEGEIVLIIEDDLPRNSWLLAKIENLIPGKDGQVRDVEVRLPSGNVVKRPINLLAPMEIRCLPDKLDSQKDASSTQSVPQRLL
uniref:DUF5641 domain-containing protein n=1 Tax=Steinernema glaseri TaxID=37863 RepID=A0A1I7YYF9_9BILA